MKFRYIISAVLILMGFGLLLDSFDLLRFGDVFSYLWPAAIILFGLIIFSKGGKSYFAGSLVVLVGVLLLIRSYLPGGFWSTLWPALLILLGVFIIKSTLWKRKKVSKHGKGKGINVMGLFSSSFEKVEDPNMEGGVVNGFFSATNVDLSSAGLKNNKQSLEINALFGDVRLIVPASWKLNVTGTPVLGSLENKTIRKVDKNDLSPLMEVNYFVMFGSIRIFYDKSIPIE